MYFFLHFLRTVLSPILERPWRGVLKAGLQCITALYQRYKKLEIWGSQLEGFVSQESKDWPQVKIAQKGWSRYTLNTYIRTFVLRSSPWAWQKFYAWAIWQLMISAANWQALLQGQRWSSCPSNIQTLSVNSFGTPLRQSKGITYSEPV